MSKKFESWAIVELFGHVKMAGRASEQVIAGATMLRVDVPAVADQAGFVRFYGSSAIYSITPTDEATARRAVEVLAVKPITVYGVVAPERQIEAYPAGTGEGVRLGGFLDEEDEDEEDDYQDEDDYPEDAPSLQETVAEQMRDLLVKNPVFLDTETTGLYEDAEVIEIAVVDVEGVVLFDRLIRPQKPIPPEASAVHGITDEMVDGAPSFDEVADELAGILYGREMIIYNAAYDLRVLEQSAETCGIAGLDNYDGVICAMELYARFWGSWDDCHGSYRWQKLTDAAEQQEIALPEGMAPHRALADAALTRRLCLKMVGEWDA